MIRRPDATAAGGMLGMNRSMARTGSPQVSPSSSETATSVWVSSATAHPGDGGLAAAGPFDAPAQAYIVVFVDAQVGDQPAAVAPQPHAGEDHVRGPGRRGSTVRGSLQVTPASSEPA